jgi:hypothetical protein
MNIKELKEKIENIKHSCWSDELQMINSKRMCDEVMKATLYAVGEEIDFDIKNFGYPKNAMGKAMQFYLCELKERLQIPTEKEHEL